MAQISTLSESLEDYLEIVLQLVREKGEARVKDIAERKAVRMASVTGAMKRLAAEGFIEHKARETVSLTPEGEELAERVLRRHEFMHRFLHEVLGVSEDIAERDACSIEHVISLETLDRLAAFVAGLKRHAAACKAETGLMKAIARQCRLSLDLHDVIDILVICGILSPCTHGPVIAGLSWYEINACLYWGERKRP